MLVAGARGEFAAERGPKFSGDGCDAGIGGKVAGVGKELKSPALSRMMAAVVLPTPGRELKIWVPGWASTSASTSVATSAR